MVTPENYADPVGDENWYTMSCADPTRSEKIYGSGLIVGLVGSATISEERRNDGQFNLVAGEGIGSIGVICAPPTPLSWTENWPFLNVVGKTIGVGKDRLSRARTYLFGKLNQVLTRVYEIRGNHNEDNPKMPYPRPVSLKACPPNYYLNGVAYIENKAGNRIFGIKQILCRRSDENFKSENQTYGAYQNSPKDTSFDLIYGQIQIGPTPIVEPLPTYFGSTVSLDQWIGNPNPGANANSVVKTRDCGVGKIMTGLGVKYNSNQEVENLRVHCTGAQYF